MGPPDDASLQVSTPERLALELPIAGVGSRALAWMVDAAILGFAWVALLFVVTLSTPDLTGAVSGLSGLGQTLLVVGAFAAQWLYWTTCEVLWRGQTPGKRVAKIRVARLDGSAPGPLESAVRNLLRPVDFLPFGYAIGVTAALLDARHRRLGDLVAGTVLLREEQVSLDRFARPPLAAIVVMDPGHPGSAVNVSPIDAELAELLRSFLARRAALLPAARERLAQKLLARLGTDLPEDERQTLSQNPKLLDAWLSALDPAQVPTASAR